MSKKIAFNSFEYKIWNINNKKFENKIEFKKVNVILGKNNFGKSFLIDLILLSAGSSNVKNKFLDEIRDKNLQKICTILNYDIINNNILIKCDWEKKENKVKYVVSINGGLEFETRSTKEISHKIFSLIDYPKYLLWEKSVAPSLLDDLFRWFFVPQESINSRNSSIKVLPYQRFDKNKYILSWLWFCEPKHQFIIKLIDSEKMMLEMNLVDSVNKTSNILSKRSIRLGNKEIGFNREYDAKISSGFEELDAISKVKRDILRKIRLQNELLKGNSSSYVNDIIDWANDDSISSENKKFINELKNRVKNIDLINRVKIKEKILILTKKLEDIKKEIKNKEKEMLTANNFRELDSKLSFVSNILQKLKKDDKFLNSNKKELANEWKRIYFDYRKKLYTSLSQSKTLNFQNFYLKYKEDGFSFSREGGAATVAFNVLDIFNKHDVLKTMGWDLPMIIDGSLAEDFDNNNYDKNNESLINKLFLKIVDRDSQIITTVSSVKKEEITKQSSEINIIEITDMILETT